VDAVKDLFPWILLPFAVYFQMAVFLRLVRELERVHVDRIQEAWERGRDV